MISIILSMIMMLLSAAAIGVLTDRRTEEALPFTFLGTGFVLYVFYCLNLLIVGRSLVYLLMAALVLGAVVKLIKNKKNQRWEKIFTPAVGLFLLLAIFFYIYSMNLKPAVWDELRLWSAMPKALHFSPYLQVGEGSLLYSTMQSYPPGMALLTYFLTSLQKNYYEFSPFFTVAVFGLALFLPALKNINWKKWFLILPAGILFLLVPTLLSINGAGAAGDWAYYYLSLFIDPVLGFLFGYGIYLAINKPFKDWFSAIHFAFCLFMLPAMKNTGAMYGGVVFLTALVIALAEKSVAKKDLLRALPGLLGLAASYGSWQLMIHVRGTGEFIDFNLGGITLQKIANVFSGITVWGKLPFLWIALFFLAVGIVMTLCLKDISKKSAGIAGLGIFAGAVIFFYGYTSHYGLMLSSIHRYTQTLTFAMFLYLLMRLMACAGERLEIKAGMSKKVLVAVAEIVLCAGAVLVMADYKNNQYPNEEYSQIRQKIEDFCEQLPEDNLPAKCYLAIGGDMNRQSQKHETYYQAAVGTDIDIKNIWCDKLVNEADWGVVEDEEERIQIWAESLAEKEYAYVLIVEPDDEIRNAVGKIAPSITVKDFMILSVGKGTGNYPVNFQIVH